MPILPPGSRKSCQASKWPFLDVQTITKVVSHRRPQYGYFFLSHHLVAVEMSDSPSIGITPSPSLPNIADGSSVHRCSIKEVCLAPPPYALHHYSHLQAVQAVMYGIRYNQAEVAVCVAANPDFVPLIHSVLPTVVEPGNPTPSA